MSLRGPDLPKPFPIKAGKELVAVGILCVVLFGASVYFDLFPVLAQWQLSEQDRARRDSLVFILFALSCALAAFSYLRWRAHRQEMQERIRVEQQHSRQLVFLETLIDTIPNAVFYKDTEGHYLGCNHAFEAFVQRPRNEIIGKTVFELGPPDIAQKYHEKDRELLENPGTQRYEWRVQGRDGRIREVVFEKATFVDESGRVAGLLGIITDITGRKQAERALRETEALYRSLVEESLVGVFMAQGEQLFYVNPRFAMLFGYTQRELTADLRASDLIAPESRAEFAEYIRLLLDEEVQTVHRTWRGVRKEGALIEVEAMVSRTMYGGNSVVLGTVLDVTERKRLEAETLRAQKLESLGVLAGGIAHDFNNLLTVILGNMSLVTARMAAGDHLREWLVEAEKASLQARDLAQQLLTFAKGGAPVKKVFSLRQVIVDAASFSIRGSGILCEFSLPEDLWPVHADEGQISQVINNLVINACQAMPNGGSIRISAQNKIRLDIESEGFPPGRYVCFRIEDQGTGIDEEHRQHIFDPYFTTKETGSGLGLATCYSVIRRHNGTITVDSVVGQGTTFTICLPAADEQPEEQPAAPRRIGPAQRRGMKVLLMDDEAQIRTLVVTALKVCGYSVETADDGAQALEKYREALEQQAPFALVIMDLTVPGGMGGRELIAELGALDPQVCAIVSSGYANDPIVAEFERYGFRGVVVKPYRVEELCEVVQNVLARCESDEGTCARDLPEA